MNRSMRVVILVAVVIAAMIIIINPFNTKIHINKKFEVTKDPVQALQKSINNGNPVFLEFYASW